MDTPTLPIILTEANWNKNKGAIAKAAGKTGLGALLKEMAAAYHRVDWDALDMDEALKDNESVKEAVAALAVAKRQVQANLPLLLKKIEAVEDQARATQAKFAKHKLIPAASTKHVGKLADAAKQFADEVKDVEEEYEKFEKAVAAKVKEHKDLKAKQKQTPPRDEKPPVSEVAGDKWFASLGKITVHRDAAVARWAFNPDIAAAADDDLFKIDRRFDPRNAQAKYAAQLKKFRVVLEQLRGLKDRKMERKDAVAQLQTGSRALLDTFETCLLSVGDLLKALKGLPSRAAGPYGTWLAAHRDFYRDTEQAVQALKKQQPLIEELHDTARKLKKD